jgi:hypothetical protein
MLTVPWVVPPGGPVGNAAPNPNNGHCIPAVSYDADNLYVVTWGEIKPMSWAFRSGKVPGTARNRSRFDITVSEHD